MSHYRSFWFVQTITFYRSKTGMIGISHRSVGHYMLARNIRPMFIIFVFLFVIRYCSQSGGSTRRKYIELIYYLVRNSMLVWHYIPKSILADEATAVFMLSYSLSLSLSFFVLLPHSFRAPSLIDSLFRFEQIAAGKNTKYMYIGINPLVKHAPFQVHTIWTHTNTQTYKHTQIDTVRKRIFSVWALYMHWLWARGITICTYNNNKKLIYHNAHFIV